MSEENQHGPTSFDLLGIVLRDQDLNQRDLCVMLALVSHYGPGGEIFPSIKRIAWLARCSEKTVKRTIAEWKEKAWIRVERRHDKRENVRQTNKYYLDKYLGVKLTSRPSESEARGHAKGHGDPQLLIDEQSKEKTEVDTRVRATTATGSAGKGGQQPALTLVESEPPKFEDLPKTQRVEAIRQLFNKLNPGGVISEWRSHTLKRTAAIMLIEKHENGCQTLKHWETYFRWMFSQRWLQAGAKDRSGRPFVTPGKFMAVDVLLRLDHVIKADEAIATNNEMRRVEREYSGS